MGEYLVIGMEPLADSDGDLSLFDVYRTNDGPQLGRSGGHADRQWGDNNRFVFLRSKN